MQEMYQKYKDVAEFRMVYIREAHAIDSNRPTRMAEQKGIKNHTNYDERCTTAQMLQEDGRLTMPMLIDRMDNSCLLYTSPSPRDLSTSRMPSSA